MVCPSKNSSFLASWFFIENVCVFQKSCEKAVRLVYGLLQEEMKRTCSIQTEEEKGSQKNSGPDYPPAGVAQQVQGEPYHILK